MNNCWIKQDDELRNLAVKKIPRPPNAFMLFANANRKLMAQKHPTESNKDISKRLGSSWKILDLNEKNKYFDRAKAIDNDHKKKYPNYVYNPKEARIRKAMREATRDRSIGASPMLPRPGVRVPAHAEWTQSQEEPLMMNSMESMRRMDTPMCNYPMSNTDNNQYMPPMNGYNKMESPLLMPNYMQPSPLSQLQQQTELWHPYQDNMRPRSIGTPYHHPMMSDMQPPSYHSQEPMQETATNLIMDKPRQSPTCAPLPLAETLSTHPSPEEHTLTPPLAINNPSGSHIDPQQQQQQLSQGQSHFVETEMQSDVIQTTVIEKGQQHDYIPDQMMNCNSYKPSLKVDQPPAVIKKDLSYVNINPSTSYYISPEVTQPATFLASPEFFSDKYHIEYISKYFSDLPNYSLITVKTKEGFSFPYATLIMNGYEASNAFLEISSLKSEPQLIPSDVGYIPVLEDDFCFDQLGSS
ncbi:hypothetical protein WA026_001007 [Henosepilachna vigintioctopunctata]|uniref:Sex-determining region Y protein n=1 Tax=Henosepilachna vigintioctopunctata TaxID=420089 RepID=A0AAW1V910_9CUCU